MSEDADETDLTLDDLKARLAQAEPVELITAIDRPGWRRQDHAPATYPLYCDTCGKLQHPVINDCSSD